MYRGLLFLCAMPAGFMLLLLAGSPAARAQETLRLPPHALRINIPDSIPATRTLVLHPATADTGAGSAKKAFFPSLDSLRKIHSPRRAALYSAVLPGLGQIYNHQYIKVPLMLGGLGVAAGVFMFNFDKYITYRDAYRLRLNNHLTGNPRVDIYTAQDLQYLRDGYRQYVDYSVLGFAAVYLYNILDAIVFAHLYHFDISNDLSRLRFGPVFDHHAAGFGLTYTFRK